MCLMSLNARIKIGQFGEDLQLEGEVILCWKVKGERNPILQYWQ